MVAPVVFKLLAGVVTRKGHARYLQMAKELIRRMKAGELAELPVSQKRAFIEQFKTFANRTLTNPKASQGYKQGLTQTQVKKDMRDAIKELDKGFDNIVKGGPPAGRQIVKLGRNLRSDLNYEGSMKGLPRTNLKKETAAYNKIVRERKKINDKNKKNREKITKKY